MRKAMPREVARLTERSAAVIAAEGFLSGVDSLERDASVITFVFELWYRCTL